MVEMQAISGTNFPRIARSIGSGHFMTRFRVKAPENINDLTRATPVRVFVKVVKKTVETATTDDLGTLKLAYEKIDEKLRYRDRPTYMQICSMPICLIGGSYIADKIRQAGASILTYKIILGTALAGFLIFAITSAVSTC